MIITDGGEVIEVDTWPVGTVLIDAKGKIWIKYGGPGIQGEMPPQFPWGQMMYSMPSRSQLMERSGGYGYHSLNHPIRAKMVVRPL